jgi:uncharacterized protein YciI
MKAMRTLLSTAACLVLVSSSSRGFAQAPAPAPPATSPPSQRLYLVEFTVGPAWVADKPPHEQLHFRGHSDNLRRLRTEGLLVLGARYSDKGIVVLKAASEEEARAQVQRDPSVEAGVFRSAVFEFRPFYDGCVAQPGSP